MDLLQLLVAGTRSGFAVTWQALASFAAFWSPHQLPRRSWAFLSWPFCLSSLEDSVQLSLIHVWYLIKEEGKYRMWGNDNVTVYVQTRGSPY